MQTVNDKIEFRVSDQLSADSDSVKTDMMLLLACFMADADLRAALKPIDVKGMQEAIKEVKDEVGEETADELVSMMENLKLVEEENKETPQIVDLSTFSEG